MNKTFTLPSTPSVAYFESVLDAFPLAILNNIVDSTKNPDSTFDPYVNEKEVVLNRVFKHSVRAGFKIFAKAIDAPLLNTIISIYQTFVEESLRHKPKVETRYPILQREWVADIWSKLGFDVFLSNLPVEILHKLCEGLGFREDVDDREQIERAIKEEILIIGFCEVISKQEIKYLKSALNAVRNEFKSLFDQYPFFEDSYCVSDSFDGGAFALFFLSFSFPHVRKEFIYYIQNSDNILNNLNSRSLKKIQSLTFTNTSSELVSSSEKDVLQVLAQNGQSSKDSSEDETERKKESKKTKNTRESKETNEKKSKEKKSKKEKSESEPPSSSVSTISQEKPSKTARRKNKSKESIVVSSKESSNEEDSEDGDNDDTKDDENSKDMPPFPSSKGKIKIEKGVTANEIYINYTAKEIYDICKIYKIKLAGNSTERSKRIAKFINEGIIETKRKRKRSTSYGASKRTK